MISIGTSGFSFPDWKGPVYPARLPAREMLAYYAHELKFTVVEINSTYYAIPDPRNMASMAGKTPDGFEFVVKAYKGMTHDPFDDRLETRPSETDVAARFRQFREALDPLQTAGKLGAVLLQFPVFFLHSAQSREYILKSQELLQGIPLVIEFRNKGWATEETFGFLKDHNLAYCVVDEPKLPRLMPFVNRVTSPVGYLRLHGRNPNWFNAPVSERYNYLYNDSELAEFVPEVTRMDGLADKVFVFFNNCHLGAAAKNAMRFREMMGLEPPSPATLFK